MHEEKKVTGKHRYKRFYRNESGVSNIVTSIMMLGIIMTILGMILTVYVPMWARSNEISHLDDASDSFIDLKITTDSQILSNDVGSKFSTRVSLGSGGGPVLGIGRNTGSLDFDSGRGTIIVYQTEDTMNIFGEGGGNLIFDSNNNYYIDQTLVYENGGIIVSQGESSIMKASPDIHVEKDPITNFTKLELSLISMVGNHRSLGGTDDRMVETVLTSDMDSPHEFDWSALGSGKNITIKFNTFDPEVWEKFFNKTFTEGENPLDYDADGAGGSQTGDFYIESMSYSGSDPALSESTDIFVHFRNIKYLDCEHAVISVTIN
jgi:hypothetical protein